MRHSVPRFFWLVALALGALPVAAPANVVTCIEKLLHPRSLPRPLPEGSGAELEVRVRSPEKPSEFYESVWGMFDTLDHTVGPVLGTFEFPSFLADKVPQGVSPRALPWASLSTAEQIALVEYVGRQLVLTQQGEPSLIRLADQYFSKVSRRIPGLVVRQPLPIQVRKPATMIFGESYGPGACYFEAPHVATAVEFGRPQDLLKLELVEVHFATSPALDVTPGENALSVRRLLAARGYPRGKQHQHAITAKAPKAEVFGGGENGRILASAVASKLVFDANLAMELLAVGFAGKSIELRYDEHGYQAVPLKGLDFLDIFTFFDLLITERPEAYGEHFGSAFKTFSVGVRGPAKFPGKAWSLEFRMLYPQLLQHYGRTIVAPLIDAATAKMQLLSGQLPGGLPGDVELLHRWTEAENLPPERDPAFYRILFAEAWPFRKRPSAFILMRPELRRLLRKPTQTFLESAAMERRYEVNWLLHDWSHTHYAHLSLDPRINAARMQRVFEAQHTAVEALNDVPTPDQVRAIVANFTRESGLIELVVESISRP